MIILIPYNELTHIDFQILKAVYENQPLTEKELAKLFPRQQALHLRIEKLTTPDRTISYHGMSFPIDNTALMEYHASPAGGEATLHLTELGIKTLEDWKSQCAKESRVLWENRFWKFAPIIISLVALVKSFWPEITTIWLMLQQAQ